MIAIVKFKGKKFKIEAEDPDALINLLLWKLKKLGYEPEWLNMHIQQ